MQNSTNKTEDVLNTIPEHLPSSNSPISETNSNYNTDSNIAPSTAVERTQNFSFSSAYTASRFGNKLGTPLSTTHFEFKPITAFTVLNRDDLATTYNAKPNAIVRPFRRPEQHLPGPLHTNVTEPTDPQLQQHQAPLQQPEASASSVTQHSNDGGSGMRQMGQDVRYFAEELNRKLRFLHGRDDGWTKPRKTSKDV